MILEVYQKELERWGQGNVVVLCPRRLKCMVSVEGLNPRLQDIVNPGRSDDHAVTIGGREFRIRDRVVQMRNTAAASNGDIGELIDICRKYSAEEESVITFLIRWENGVVTGYTREEMNSVELEDALTIHKS